MFKHDQSRLTKTLMKKGQETRRNGLNTTMNKKPIRVLLVEDSPVAVIILKRILNSSPDIQVVGTARTGIEGLNMIPLVQPHVICTDLHMPQMNGLEFTEEVMANCPRPILVISASVQPENKENVFELLAAGAIDVFPKPRAGMRENYEAIKQELITKVRVLSGVSVFTLRRKRHINQVQPCETPTKQPSISTYQKSSSPKIVTQVSSIKAPEKSVIRPSVKDEPSKLGLQRYRVVTIGASTGGPQALQTILSQLPPKFPVPVICIQHISQGFLQGLVDWLARECRLPVKIATFGELPQPGHIYFTPEAKHLEFDRNGRFIYSSAAPYSGHRPSVTVTFNSIAQYYGRSSVGILLTGMGRDGADGMQAIAQAGGLTIAQDEPSCVVFGMPKEAIALGAAQYILPVKEIAPLLVNRLFLNYL